MIKELYEKPPTWVAFFMVGEFPIRTKKNHKKACRKHLIK